MATQRNTLTMASFHRVRQIAFTGGDDGTSDDSLAIGDVFDEDGAGVAEGYVCRIETDSGAWADGDAAGTIWYIKKNEDTDEFAAADTCSVTGKTTVFTIGTVQANSAGQLNLRTNSCAYVAQIIYTPGTGFTDPVRLLWHDITLIIDSAAGETFGFLIGTGGELCIPVNSRHGRMGLDHREGSFFTFARWDGSVLDIYVGFQGIQGVGDDNDVIPNAVMSLELGSAGECGNLIDLNLDDVTAVEFIYETSEDITGGAGGSGSGVVVTSGGVGGIGEQ